MLGENRLVLQTARNREIISGVEYYVLYPTKNKGEPGGCRRPLQLHLEGTG